MTKEEAIELVKSAFDAWEYNYDTGDDWSKEHEARDMAIQALKQTRWIPVSEGLPKDGTYHVTRKTNRGNVIGTVSYATDLYTIDKFDFADKKGKGGWYGYDSDFGFYEVTDSIIAWRELLEPYVPDINVGKIAEREVKNENEKN